MPAGSCAITTTPAATGTARSARRWPRSAGSPPGGPSFCRCRTSMWCSPCRMSSTRSPRAIPRVLYGLLFERRRTTLHRVRREPALARAARSALTAGACTPGARHSRSTCTCIAWSPAGHSRGDGHWIQPRSGFLFPVEALSAVFRASSSPGFKRLSTAAHSTWPAAPPRWPTRARAAALCAALYASRWVVYAKPPFAGPEQVLDYLAATPTASRSPTTGW